MSSRITIAVAATALVIQTTAVAGAQGVAFVVVDGPYAQAELHQLNLATGDMVPVGAIGHPVTHMAFDSRGSLYGVGFDQNQLMTIDLMSGSGAEVGPFGFTATDVRGLTSCDGDRLWMAAADTTFGPALYEIDRNTGAATRFVDLAAEFFGSLACDGETLFVARNSLAQVDTSTGVITPVPTSDFEIWLARAVDFDDHGTLWSLLLCGPCMGPGDVLTIRTIDPASGVVGADGPFEPHGTWGLAILPGGLFLDGFESRGTTPWSATVDHNQPLF